MRRFFDELVNVIVENQSNPDPSMQANWNGAWQERTHAFNGQMHKMLPTARQFSKFGDATCAPCFLTQVFRRLHPGFLKSQGEEVPFFEYCRYDCCYFTDVRTHDRFGYPVEWKIECLIEIENNMNEFAMTVRGLLDVIAAHRVAVFYDDVSKPVPLEVLSDRFNTPWQAFVSRYPFANTFHLGIVLLPSRFADEHQFRKDAQYAEWIEKGGVRQFIPA